MSKQSKRVLIVLDSELINKLDNVAKSNGLTRSAVIRVILTKYFNRRDD